MSTSDPAGAPHLPVMVGRITTLLTDGIADGVVVDCTLGAGGHSAAVLEATGPGVRVIGIDRDPTALDIARARLVRHGDRVRLVHAPFDELTEAIGGDGPVIGVLYDLGVSSMQLDTAGRGFSFRADAPLDLRMDPTTGTSAADLLATLPTPDLARLLGRGEVRAARRIAEAISAAAPITTTRQLADVVATATPAALRRGATTHPATVVFQALRIAVNDELTRLSASLPQALGSLARTGEAAPDRGGRLAVLAYHSQEDRIVKRALVHAATGCTCPPDLPVCACGREPLVTHVVRGDAPDATEVETNPRSRSARLRVVERTAAPATPGASADTP